MELTAIDGPDLDGTGRVRLRLANASPDLAPGGLVRLTYGPRSCGAIVDRIEGGDGQLVIDPSLRVFLHARRDYVIGVDPAAFPNARTVTLNVPPAWNGTQGAGLLKAVLRGRPIVTGQSLSYPMEAGGVATFEVLSITPLEIATVDTATGLSVDSTPRYATAAVTYAEIGGLDKEIRRIRELVEYPLRSPDVFGRIGIESPRGLLLYGPPGTGKTLIARALSTEVGATCFTIQGPEIVSAYVGEPEKQLRKKFDQAHQQAPAIILIDEVDAIAPKRDESRGEMERRLVTTLLTLMDGLTDRRGVVVIGTTNRLNAIDPALRRPGRFEYEIHIGVPDEPGRRQVLEIRTRQMPLAPDVSLADIAAQTSGYVGADLASLCREAARCTMRRVVPEPRLAEGQIGPEVTLTITAADFRQALASTKPSALRELVVEIPADARWDAIGGLDDVKQLLRENVLYAVTKRDVYRAVGLKPAQGLLLYGPPGTGKSMLAKAVAHEAGVHLVAIRGPEIKSKWFGESEERLRFVFARAREVAPSIVLLDELDAIASARGGGDHRRPEDSVVNQLLTEMDTLHDGSGVFVIGTTNQSDHIDPALLRPGRFDYQVFVPEPDAAGRLAIFAIHLRDKPPLDGIGIDELVAETDGLSGADIAEVCRLGVLNELRARGFDPTGIRTTERSLRDAIGHVRNTQARLGQPGFF